MLKKLKTYLQYGNLYCGVEHSIQLGEDVIYCTVLKKNKDTLDVEKVFKEVFIENTILKIPKKQPLFLVVNNDNVLTKHIVSEENELEKLVYHAFPNINLEEFFYESITHENRHLISICRKVYINELIDKYKHNGAFVIDISLGNALISNVALFIKDEHVVTSNAFVSLKNQEIISIDKNDIIEIKTYDINGLQVNSNQILSLAASLIGIMPYFNPENNFNNLKDTIKEDYLQSRYYTQFLKFGLLFILVILIVNFLAFNHYFNEVNSLQQTSEMNETSRQKIIKLNGSVNKTQKMVEDMLKGSSSKSSFYVNAIIQGLPNSILLSDLNYQPIVKRIKTGQPIETENNMILISGESSSSEQFSKWVANLEGIIWIEKVEITNYEDVAKHLSKFSLKLNVTNDKKI